MSPELKEEVEMELAMLRQHLDAFASARSQATVRPPDTVAKAALGAMLHGFYGGVENLFKRIALHCDGGPPQGVGSHAALLALMAQARPTRPPAISGSLAADLREFMRFRHVFRNAYTNELRWRDMAGLVSACPNVLSRLQNEIGVFLKSFEAMDSADGDGAGEVGTP